MDNKTKKSTGNQISSKDNVILHLSDLHFGYDKNEQKKADREIVLKELIDVLSKLRLDWKPTIVCISGDIAWSAKKLDYKAAGKWFKKLFKILDITNENVVICPGNHDVNRHEASYICRPKNPKEADEVLKVPISSLYNKPFNEYMNFYKRIGVPPLNFGDNISYLVGYRIIQNIRFVSCNSAWFSKDEDDEGNLWLGLKQLEYLYSKDQLPSTDVTKGGQVTIALFHHPGRWLDKNETDQFYNRTATLDYLAERCHLILTGHSHGSLRDADGINNQAHHLGGGATYSGLHYQNNFRLIKITADRFIYKSFEWDPRATKEGWSSVRNPENIMFLECKKIIENNLVLEFEQQIKKRENELLAKERQTDFSDNNVSSSSPQQTVVLIKQTKEEIKIYDESIESKEKSINDELIVKKGKIFLRRIENQLAVLDLKNAFAEGQQLERWIANNENKIPSNLAAELYELLVNIELTKKNRQLPKNKAWDLSRVNFFLEKAKNVIEREE